MTSGASNGPDPTGGNSGAIPLGPTVAAVVRRAMTDQNLTVLATARELGVSRGFIRRIVEGQPPPRRRAGRETADKDERYEALAKLLHVPVGPFRALVQSEQRSERQNEAKALELAFMEAWQAVVGAIDSALAAELLPAGQLVATEVGRNQGQRLRDRIRRSFPFAPAPPSARLDAAGTASVVPTFRLAPTPRPASSGREIAYRRLATAVLGAAQASFEQRGLLASILYELAARDVSPAALLEMNKAR